MNYTTQPNGLKICQWALTVLTLVILFSSTLAPVVRAADSTSTLVTQTDRTADNDDNNATAGFVIPGDQKTDVAKTSKTPAIKILKVDITAYTSTVHECDADPFVTADGTLVRDGIVAINSLPFGTLVRIPKYFGDRVFVVHDRMSVRYSRRADIWMSDKTAMRKWGLKRNVTIEVVSMGDGKTQWSKWTRKSLAVAAKEVERQLKEID